MLGKKTALLIILLSLGAWKFNSIEVPRNFEKPVAFRVQQAIFNNVIPFYMKLGKALGWGDQYSLFLAPLKKMFVKESTEHPKIERASLQINGVNVTTFKPVDSIDAKDLPIVIYYHGGGYAVGNTEFYAHYLNELSIRLKAFVISVDYRLAPKHPYPAPTDDCYAVTKYVLESKNEFGNTDKVVIAGDSAGGNAVAVMTQRLKAENLKLPRLQVLIYPWLNLFNFRMASNKKYASSNLGAFFVCWYIGINDDDQIIELASLFPSNEVTTLVKDKARKEKLMSYTDSKLVPEQYKSDYDYYDNYDIRNDFPKDSNHPILKNPEIVEKLNLLSSAEVSPGLADTDKLKGLPEAYFIVAEFDELKDISFTYAHRLREAGVKTEVKHYEDSYHGMTQMVDEKNGLKVANKMLTELVDYIEKNIF